MRKIAFIVAAVFLLVLVGCGNKVDGNAIAGSGEKITVFKSQSCGCCGGFISELQKEGFNVETVISNNVNEVKDQYEVPSYMRSCHTSIVGDYVVEGHVPSEAINKLLAEKPDIKGIALPGMPAGSTGMPGRKSGPFKILTLDGEVFMEI